MALTRLQQLCLRAEAVEGTFLSPFTSTYANYLAIDPSLTFDVETYERSVARESFTPLAPLAGAVLGSASFSLEATSRSATYSTTNTPSFDLPLVACGFQRLELFRIQIAAGALATSPLLHGTVITQGTSTATLTVVGNYYADTPTQYIWATKGPGYSAGTLAGLYGNDIAPTSVTTWTWTGSATPGLTASAGTPAITALGWVPTSSSLYSITCGTAQTLANGTVLVGATSGAIGVVVGYSGTAASRTGYFIRRVQGTFGSETVTPYVAGVAGSTFTVSGFAQLATHSPALSIGVSKDGVLESLTGARGTVSISGNIGEPILFAFNFSGVKNAVTDSGSVSGVSFIDRTPPVLLGATMNVGDVGITSFSGQKSFCASAFSLDVANDIQYRRCLTAATGIDGIYINGRTPTGTIDPEQSPEIDFDWMANFFSTGNLRMDLVAGSGADKFRFKINNMAIGSVGQGDRNGIIIRDIGFNLHSGSTSSVSGDNEMCIIWDPSV
jgi:hypothetical protein